MIEIETPLAPMKAPVLAGKKLVLAPILRAGIGMLDGMLSLVPSARVAHIGLYRDPETLVAVEYYFKAPEDIADRLVLVLDPMLATGNSAVAAVDRLKEAARRTSASSACWPRPRGSRNSAAIIPTCTSGPPRSTSGSTSTATSFPASATPATGCTGRSDSLVSRAAGRGATR